MKLVYVRWRDVMKEEAETRGPAKPTVMTLEEIGWLAAENEEAITIAMGA